MTSMVEMVDPSELAMSREYCREVTRWSARNFYYALRLLPAEKRSAMFVLYAYMRLVDDIADEEDGRTPAQRGQELEQWRQQTRCALDGAAPTGRYQEVWPAFVEMVRRYRMPAEIFDEAIAGQQQDLEPIRFRAFPELRQYCYRVAGVVGLASIHIWGHEGGEETAAMAVDRGIAFQLTNILRDLREDLSRGRVYLPQEELEAAGMSEDALRDGAGGEAFGGMMRRQIERAESYYQRSAALEDRIERDSRPALAGMTGIYHGLLAKIAADPSRVLRERVSLSLFHKLLICWRAFRR